MAKTLWMDHARYTTSAKRRRSFHRRHRSRCEANSNHRFTTSARKERARKVPESEPSACELDVYSRLQILLRTKQIVGVLGGGGGGGGCDG